METYIAILRGINVSGHKKISMVDLRESLTQLSFTNIKTYIQSGNLVFNHPASDPLQLASQIENNIQKNFGYEVPVIVLPVKEWKKIADNNPFVKEQKEDIASLHITFLAEKPKAELTKKLQDVDYSPDEFVVDGNAVYLFCPNGYGRTKLTNSFFESKLKTKATTRNLKTVNKLLEMAEALS